MGGCRSFCSPGDVVDVAEGVGDHGLCICTLIRKIADLVPEEPPYEVAVSGHMHEDDEVVNTKVDSSHDQDADLIETAPIYTSCPESQVDEHDVVSHKPPHCKGKERQHSRHHMRMFSPHRPRQPSCHPDQIHHYIQDGHYLSGYLDVKIIRSDLVDGCKQNVEVNRRREVTSGKGEQGQHHGKVELDVFVHEAVFGLHGVEVVVLVDVEEGEETAVDPSTTLLHQVLMIFHGICLRNSIWHVTQVVLLLSLAVYAETEDTILSQVHIGLTVVLLLQFRVQDHLEVTVLQQVRLVLL